MKRSKRVDDSRTTMTELIMPNDTNPLGNLMGGNLMHWMDIAGGICAGKHCEAYVVTASVDHVSFQHPIKLGSVISINAQVTRAFKTSVEVYLEVYVSDFDGKNTRKCNHAYMTFVALDEDKKKPIEVPQLDAVTPAEILLFESAVRRREVRMILSGRMKPEEAKDLKAYFGDMN